MDRFCYIKRIRPTTTSGLCCCCCSIRFRIQGRAQSALQAAKLPLALALAFALKSRLSGIGVTCPFQNFLLASEQKDGERGRGEVMSRSLHAGSDRCVCWVPNFQRTSCTRVLDLSPASVPAAVIASDRPCTLATDARHVAWGSRHRGDR
ncbi:hypothetical protein SEVIR_9G482150v4 [Setaria viridis]